MIESPLVVNPLQSGWHFFKPVINSVEELYLTVLKSASALRNNYWVNCTAVFGLVAIFVKVNFLFANFLSEKLAYKSYQEMNRSEIALRKFILVSAFTVGLFATNVFVVKLLQPSLSTSFIASINVLCIALYVKYKF